MRNRFDRQLDELNSELIDMGALCEQGIDAVAKALQGEKGMTAKAYELETEIDQKEKEIETLCLKLLLQQQPVASDLRLISAALKMISDMERIGDQCSDIADIVKFLKKTNTLELKSGMHIQDMAGATKKMVTQAIDSFVSKDLEIARAVMQADDQVDDLFAEVKNEISTLIATHPEHGEAILDFLMIAKYFERIGDHTTNLAEWVEFSITGEHPKAQ